MNDGTRLEDVKRFYEILGKLERRLGGRRILAECSKYSGWPTRGVYFFMEDGEKRSESGEGFRVVRIGISRAFWHRLNRHKSKSSSFRTDIGSALINKHEINYSYYTKWWNRNKSSTSSTIKNDPAIKKLETGVTKTIGEMPFLCLKVDNEELRDDIESNAIALLSNFWRKTVDSPSDTWLGHHCTDKHGKIKDKVKESGLWNSEYVRDNYNPNFLDKLEELVDQMESVR